MYQTSIVSRLKAIMGPTAKTPFFSNQKSSPNYQTLSSTSSQAMFDEDTKETARENEMSCCEVVKENLLILLTLLGVALGFGLGFGIRPLNPSPDAMLWIGLPGEIYMRMLTCTILPLVVSSIIAGTSSLDPKSNGKISTIALVYITLANLLGVLFGLAMYFIVKPGEGVEAKPKELDSTDTNLQTQDLFVDLIRNLFPDNVVTACFQTTQTVYVPHKAVQALNNSNATIEELVRSKGTSSSMNILGLIVISSAIGMATAQVGEVAKPVVYFFRGMSEVIIKVLRWIVWVTPIGVISLIAASIAAVEDLESTFESVGMFALSVSVSMAIFVFLLYPLLYFIVTRNNPIRFLVICIRPLMTSLATSSTAVAMPDMFNVAETKLGIDIRISRFIIPFSDALNRSGSCCFILIAAIFLCKLEHVELEAPKYLVIAILTWVSGFAIPSVPSASIISMLIILASVNVQSSNVGLLLALEWLLDRLRTSANAMSIICGTVLTNQLCSKDLNKLVDVDTTSVISEVSIKVTNTPNGSNADTKM